MDYTTYTKLMDEIKRRMDSTDNVDEWLGLYGLIDFVNKLKSTIDEEQPYHDQVVS